jgi:hypothetical protein
MDPEDVEGETYPGEEQRPIETGEKMHSLADGKEQRKRRGSKRQGAEIGKEVKWNGSLTKRRHVWCLKQFYIRLACRI